MTPTGTTAPAPTHTPVPTATPRPAYADSHTGSDVGSTHCHTRLTHTYGDAGSADCYTCSTHCHTYPAHAYGDASSTDSHAHASSHGDAYSRTPFRRRRRRFRPHLPRHTVANAHVYRRAHSLAHPAVRPAAAP